MSGKSDYWTNETYAKNVASHFDFLKATTRLDDLMVKSIPLPGERGFLVPVAALHLTDTAVIDLLAVWRTENEFAFPTRFPVTDTGTAEWLRDKVLGVRDRMLWLVIDKHGRALGHMGLANAVNDRREVEIDNVIRGVKNAEPGIMAAALRALLDWTQEFLMPDVISLLTFKDNTAALAFYTQLGFREEAEIPLRMTSVGETVSYAPLAEGDTAPADDAFLQLVYPGEQAYDGAELVLTAGPSMSARETSYAFDAARNGWGINWSGYLDKFEADFAAYLGVKYAITTSSCTGALHLGLLAAGIGPGDEVIVPDITWVATANAVTYVGATPIFADIEPGSWCLDPASFESLITPRTKAVMPVHLYGHPARMDVIMRVAEANNLLVIEDAAPAIGAEFRGRKVGTFGNLAAFSFQGAKLLVTGEGGMLVTNDDNLYRQARSLWDQGRDPDRTFWINRIGWKYKMSNIQAALGVAQLERVDELIAAKRRLFGWYADGLDGTPGLTLMHEQEWARSICWMSSLTLDTDAPVSRDELRSLLRERNVDSRPVFPAISQYPIWPEQQATQPVAKRVGDNALNLPSKGNLTRGQVDYVCRCVRDILASGK